MSDNNGRPQAPHAQAAPQGEDVAALGQESGAAPNPIGADGDGSQQKAQVSKRKRSIAKLRNVVWTCGPARGLVYVKPAHVRDLLAELDDVNDAMVFVLQAIESATGEKPVVMFVPELLERWRRSLSNTPADAGRGGADNG